MKIDDVKKLGPGDRVYWNDPDDGIGSGIVTIKTITVKQDRFINIETESGREIECYPSEISRPAPGR